MVTMVEPPPAICWVSRWSATIWPKGSPRSGCAGPVSGSHASGDPLSRLHRAGEGAAVEQDVLAGDEAGLGTTQEGAGEAEFLRIADPAGGIFAGALIEDFLHRNPRRLGLVG